MFNLLISGDDEAWNGEPHPYDRSRIFEYTEDAIAARFNELNEQQVENLLSLPTVFAFEKSIEKDARIGRIRTLKFQHRSVMVEYEFDENAPVIPHALLLEQSEKLDIIGWELNRTHWAVKDVDLVEVLTAAGLDLTADDNDIEADQLFANLPIAAGIPVLPNVFRLPTEPIDQSLVAVMGPFGPGFDAMFEAVNQAAGAAGLVSQNVRQIWDAEEIIQDIFSLIFRSTMVVCDFSQQNPNVFYEAGIAHTLGKTLIPIAQSIDDLPFDLRHHRAQIYENDEHGLERLTQTLTARMLRITELAL